MTNNYLGSQDVQTSVSGVECLPQKPIDWTLPYYFKKISFVNLADCHISINGGNYIYLKGNDGVSTELGDSPIYSIKIQENGIQYYYLGEI
jgi:hypothetical protein